MTTFSKQQLHQVRNAIPMTTLINDALQLERRFDKIWRFRCPLCGQFHTAVQIKTNLARCFDCQRNFNTIDLVIYCKKVNFAPSVEFLLQLLPKQSEQCNNKKSYRSSPDEANLKPMDKKQALAALDKMKQLLG